MSSHAIVITSIYGVTPAVEAFLEFDDWDVILVGDKRTPDIDQSEHDSLEFVSVDNQLKSDFSLDDRLPYNHYARKNMGYLYGLSSGYDMLADSDDDNIPKPIWPEWLSADSSIDLVKQPRFPNVYEAFTDEFTWPRGYPLEKILAGDSIERSTQTVSQSKLGVIQGLADGEPDVDAIYRLVVGEQIIFDPRDPIALDREVYSPFNSQNTLWPQSEAYPYLYLPSQVNFRFTDILRGYVAQRGLWAMDLRLGFVGANVVQERNPHDLLSDFRSEIPCYTQITRVADILDDLDLGGRPIVDIETMYCALVEKDIIPYSELDILDAWLSDLDTLNYQ